MKEKVLRLVQKYKKTFEGKTPTSVYLKITSESQFYGQPISKILDVENYVIFIFLVCSKENDLSKSYDILKNTIFNVEILEVTDDDPESECDTCYGSGQTDCDTCDGEGEVHCDTCDGEGVVSDLEGNEDECSDCYGGGKVPCDSCGGNGQEECYECDGTGYIRHGDYYEVNTYTIVSYDSELFERLTYLPQYSILENTTVHEIMENKKCFVSLSHDERFDLATKDVNNDDYVFDEISDLGEILANLNPSGKIK